MIRCARTAVSHQPTKKTTTTQREFFGAISESFSLDAQHDRKRIGKVAQSLAKRGATPEELAIRLRRYKAEWPTVECSPEAIVKHWARFAGGNGRASEVEPPSEHSLLLEARAKFGDAEVDSHSDFWTGLVQAVESGERTPRKIRQTMDEAADVSAFRKQYTEVRTHVDAGCSTRSAPHTTWDSTVL